MHPLIASLGLHLSRELLQLGDHDAAVGQPERQSRADFFVEDKDVQIATQFAMVAFLGLFEHLQVLVEFFFVAPGRAVDPLQHGVMLIAAPVRARHRSQFEAVRGDLAGMFQMWTAAEILEAVLLVGADHRLLGYRIAIFVDASRFQPIDQFQLVGLIVKEIAGFVSSDLAIGKWMPAADNLAHPLLDGL